MSPRPLVILFLALAALWLSSGCYTMRAQVPGALRGDLESEQVEVLGTFELDLGHVYFFWGLVGAPPDDLFAAAVKKAAEEHGADGIANLAFESHHSATDLLIAHVTLGVVAPRSYRFRGDLVAIDAPVMPGRPLVGEERRRRRDAERRRR